MFSKLQTNMKSQSFKRDSNIELLRIVAMILVLVVHADFLSLGAPNMDDLISSPCDTCLRVLIESLSIVCVNVFVLISGWFGIKSSLSRFLCFLFQIYFLELVIYVFYLIWGEIDAIYFRDWMNILLCNDYWFVRAYIILYLFAPALNVWLEMMPKKQIEQFLFSFFAIQTLLDFWWGTSFSGAGYSGLSFMGLYVLARYIHLYPNKLSQQNKYVDLTIYLVLTLLTSFAAFVQMYTHGTVGWFYYYDSPFVILAAVYLLLFFTKMSIRSKFVNWVAVSCFAAYILHCSPLFLPDYKATIKAWFDQEPRWSFVCYTMMWIVIVFSLSILVDKIRMVVWHLMCLLWGNLQKKVRKDSMPDHIR